MDKNKIPKFFERFKNKKLVQILEFPVLFLGALPEKTPALYSLMNYADIKGGTWYPEFGMYSIVQAMYDLATSLGVQFKLGEEVTSIEVVSGKAIAVHTLKNATGEKQQYTMDVLIGAGDYHHIETKLLAPAYQSYSSAYWDTRVMAPSSLLCGTGTTPSYSKIADTTGLLPAGQWEQMDFDGTASGGTRLLVTAPPALGWPLRAARPPRRHRVVRASCHGPPTWVTARTGTPS